MSQQPEPKELSFLEKQAMTWAQKVVELHKTDFPPALQAKKAALMESAKKINTALEVFFKNAPWLAELNRFNAVPSQLGFVFVPLAVITVAGVMAYITKWSYDFAALMMFRRDRDTLIAAGMTPEQAAAVAGKNYENKSKSFFSFNMDLKKWVIPAALILGGIYYIKKRA